MQSKPKKVLKMSLRSEIHATDCTCIGWMAKKAAKKKLHHKARVMRAKIKKTRKVFRQCSPIFVKWCGPALTPKNCTSSAWEIHVIGCQFAAMQLFIAQPTVSTDRPLRTCGFPVT